NSQLNELRVQYAHRHQQSVTDSDSGPAPSIAVAGIATFGGPYYTTGQGGAGIDFKQNITEVVDNYTFMRSNHSYKDGFDGQWVHDVRVSAPVQQYSFPTIAAYQLAKTGVNPFSYSTFSQVFGDLGFSMDTG